MSTICVLPSWSRISVTIHDLPWRLAGSCAPPSPASSSDPHDTDTIASTSTAADIARRTDRAFHRPLFALIPTSPVRPGAYASTSRVSLGIARLGQRYGELR